VHGFSRKLLEGTTPQDIWEKSGPSWGAVCFSHTKPDVPLVKACGLLLSAPFAQCRAAEGVLLEGNVSCDMCNLIQNAFFERTR